MTKEEMRKKFIELDRTRIELIMDARIEGIAAEDDESDKVVAQVMTLNRKILAMLVQYLLDQIQPFSENSLVWWAVTLEHMSEHMKGLFDPRQNVEYMLAKETLNLIDVAAVMVDMSQFPGGGPGNGNADEEQG